MLAARFPFNTKKEWSERILAGNVGVNSHTVTPQHILKENETVFHFNPAVIEPSVPDEVRILEETADYLAVYKPAPLPVHAGGRYYKNTLIRMLHEMGYEDLKIVHRLDAVTSGIILFGKTKTFAQKALRCFRDNEFRKVYYALVSGVPAEQERTISTPIRRKHGFVFETGNGLSGAKPAETGFSVVAAKLNRALIKCVPVTGRTHQIRLHLKEWGYPVIDDPVYGPGSDNREHPAQNSGISLLGGGLLCSLLGIDLQIELPEAWQAG